MPQNSRHFLKGYHSRAAAKRTFAEKLADRLTAHIGSLGFLVANMFCFVAWIFVNLGYVPGLAPFDPFPFGLLTMVMSIEAIFLTIVVLISQNRLSKIDDIRQEIDMQVDLYSEQEITKALEMLQTLLHLNGVDTSTDLTLKEMLKPTDTKKIEETLEKEVS